MFERIDKEEVFLLLQSLDTSRAVGMDGIDSKILRIAAPAISQSLTSLFNLSIRSGQVGSEWKHARVTQIPKVKNSQEVNNFRPISVLPVVSKVLERIVHCQLYSYL